MNGLWIMNGLWLWIFPQMMDYDYMDYDYGLWTNGKKYGNTWWIVMECVNYMMDYERMVNEWIMDPQIDPMAIQLVDCDHICWVLKRGLTIPDSLSGHPMRPTGAMALVGKLGNTTIGQVMTSHNWLSWLIWSLSGANSGASLVRLKWVRLKMLG